MYSPGFGAGLRGTKTKESRSDDSVVTQRLNNEPGL